MVQTSLRSLSRSLVQIWDLNSILCMVLYGWARWLDLRWSRRSWIGYGLERWSECWSCCASHVCPDVDYFYVVEISTEILRHQIGLLWSSFVDKKKFDYEPQIESVVFLPVNFTNQVGVIRSFCWEMSSLRTLSLDAHTNTHILTWSCIHLHKHAETHKHTYAQCWSVALKTALTMVIFLWKMLSIPNCLSIRPICIYHDFYCH